MGTRKRKTNKLLTTTGSWDLNLTDSNSALISDDISVLRQQIDILFDSTPGDLHGDINYGTDYEYMLFELKLSETQLKQKILADINSLDLRGFTPEVEVYLMVGTEREIALICVTLTKDYKKISKTYKIV